MVGQRLAGVIAAEDLAARRSGAAYRGRRRSLLLAATDEARARPSEGDASPARIGCVDPSELLLEVCALPLLFVVGSSRVCCSSSRARRSSSNVCLRLSRMCFVSVHAVYLFRQAVLSRRAPFRFRDGFAPVLRAPPL